MEFIFYEIIILPHILSQL